MQIPTDTPRAEKYELLLQQAHELVRDEPDLVANLANISSLVRMYCDFLWIGFYRRVGDELVLGPFHGPVACTRIAVGKGVCGTAARDMKTIVVPNVDDFPGHIACSSSSKSEVVVPLVVGGVVELVLDVDNDQVNAFDDTDVRFFEQLVELIRLTHFE